MKICYLAVALLLIPPSLVAQVRYTKQQVVSYGKALDVAKLDATLSSRRLENWLRSRTIHLDAVTWEVSDCDLKPVNSSYVAPLCIRVRLVRGVVGG